MPSNATDRKAAAVKAAATRAANKAAKAAQAAQAAAIASEPARHATTPASERLAPLTSTAPTIIPAETTDAECSDTVTPELSNKREHYHRARGVSAEHYSGLSSYFNTDRKTAIPVGNTKYAVTLAQLTARGLGLHTALRNAYGDAAFPARGLDNAILARLISAKLIEHVSGGTRGTRDGIAYLFDGDEQAFFALTELGQTYGRK